MVGQLSDRARGSNRGGGLNPGQTGSHGEYELLIFYTQLEIKTSLLMMWNIDADPLMVLHTKP